MNFFVNGISPLGNFRNVLYAFEDYLIKKEEGKKEDEDYASLLMLESPM